MNIKINDFKDYEKCESCRYVADTMSMYCSRRAKGICSACSCYSPEVHSPLLEFLFAIEDYVIYVSVFFAVLIIFYKISQNQFCW